MPSNSFICEERGTFELGDVEAEVTHVENFRAGVKQKAGGVSTLAAGLSGGGKSREEDGQDGADHEGKKKGKHHGAGRDGQGRGQQYEPRQ